jgi:hypothetical protein
VSATTSCSASVGSARIVIIAACSLELATGRRQTGIVSALARVITGYRSEHTSVGSSRVASIGSALVTIIANSWGMYTTASSSFWIANIVGAGIFIITNVRTHTLLATHAQTLAARPAVRSSNSLASGSGQTIQDRL